MVLVLDKHKKPFMPCSKKRSRQWLEHGRAVIYQMARFSIRWKDSASPPDPIKFEHPYPPHHESPMAFPTRKPGAPCDPVVMLC